MSELTRREVLEAASVVAALPALLGDSAGHSERPMSLRWARGDETLPEVRTRVVPLDALASELA